MRPVSSRLSLTARGLPSAVGTGSRGALAQAIPISIAWSSNSLDDLRRNSFLTSLFSDLYRGSVRRHSHPLFDTESYLKIISHRDTACRVSHCRADNRCKIATSLT